MLGFTEQITAVELRMAGWTASSHICSCIPEKFHFTQGHLQAIEWSAHAISVSLIFKFNLLIKLF